MPRELRYLGLIGSRAKVARLYEALRGEGLSAAQMHMVHAPVGLDIGAVTPQEIAVSILAELIAVKYGKLPAATDDATGIGALQWTPPARQQESVAADG